MNERKAYEFAKKYLEGEVKKATARVAKARESGVNLDTQEAILELREVNRHLDSIIDDTNI